MSDAVKTHEACAGGAGCYCCERRIRIIRRPLCAATPYTRQKRAHWRNDGARNATGQKPSCPPIQSRGQVPQGIGPVANHTFSGSHTGNEQL